MLNLYKDNFFITQSTIIASSTDIEDNNEFEEVKPVRTKLYVSNFPQNSTRRQLTEFFNKFGNVLECAIMWDSYAFIHYASRKEASYALKKASMKRFRGNKLFIQLSTSRNRQDSNWYKKEVEKLEIQLFSLEKSIDCLNVNNGQSSANVNETKLYVTNLPDNCDQIELKDLFEKYGKVLECVVMWNQYAFIHYSDANDARNGQMNLHGYLLEGKHLIVQFSTTSNRPLPKCKVFENTKQIESSKEEEETPATILCYRASEYDDTSDKKDWIKILSEGLKEIKVSLSDIPTPDTPLLTNKIPYIPQIITNSNDIMISLDQIPTPPLPTTIDLSSSSSSSVDISDYPISSSHSVSPYTLSLDEDTEDIFESWNNNDTCCW